MIKKLTFNWHSYLWGVGSTIPVFWILFWSFSCETSRENRRHLTVCFLHHSFRARMFPTARGSLIAVLGAFSITMPLPLGGNHPQRVGPGLGKPVYHNIALLVGGVVAIFGIFPYIGNVIIPIDEVIFFRGVALAHQPVYHGQSTMGVFPSLEGSSGTDVRCFGIPHRGSRGSQDTVSYAWDIYNQCWKKGGAARVETCWKRLDQRSTMVGLGRRPKRSKRWLVEIILETKSRRKSRESGAIQHIAEGHLLYLVFWL